MDRYNGLGQDQCAERHGRMQELPVRYCPQTYRTVGYTGIRLRPSIVETILTLEHRGRQDVLCIADCSILRDHTDIVRSNQMPSFVGNRATGSRKMEQSLPPLQQSRNRITEK